MTDETDRRIAPDETPELFAADRIEGAPVFGAEGEPLGRISRLMIRKRDGRVVYAVLAFDGAISAGEKLCPLPWKTLEWLPEQGGFRVSATRAQVEGAPGYEPGREPRWDETAYGAGIDGYWGVGPGGPEPVL